MRTAGRPLTPLSYAKYVRGGAGAGPAEPARHGAARPGAAAAAQGGRRVPPAAGQRPLKAAGRQRPEAWPSRSAGRSPSCGAGGPSEGRRAAGTATAGAAHRRVSAGPGGRCRGGRGVRRAPAERGARSPALLPAVSPPERLSLPKRGNSPLPGVNFFGIPLKSGGEGCASGWNGALEKQTNKPKLVFQYLRKT